MTLDQLAPALVNAQSELLHVVKSKQGARGAYAPFPDVVESIRPILNRHGLAFTQHAVQCEGGVTLRTMLIHTSGQSLADDGLFVPAAKHDPQAFGSAHSYARRYSLLAMLGVATDDDDGERALRAFEKQAAAEAAAAAVPRVSDDQARILALLAVHARPTLDLDTKQQDAKRLPADDYPRAVQAALSAAVKAKRLAREDADQLVYQLVDAGDLDAAGLETALATGAA